MSNENIENNQEENQNKPEENKLFGLKLTYRLRASFYILALIVAIFMIINSIHFFKDTYI